MRVLLQFGDLVIVWHVVEEELGVLGRQHGQVCCQDRLSQL